MYIILLFPLLLLSEGVSFNFSNQTWTLAQCPSRKSSKFLQKNLISSSFHKEYKHINNLSLIKKHDETLLYTIKNHHQSPATIDPPLFYPMSRHKYLVFWQELAQQHTTIYCRSYDTTNKVLGKPIKVALVTTLSRLQLTVKRLDRHSIFIEWCRLRQCGKKLTFSRLFHKKRRLGGASNTTLNSSTTRPNLIPNQVVPLNKQLVVSTKIVEGYPSTLQQLLRKGEKNLTGSWWHYNNNTDLLSFYPTHETHIGTYSFLIQVQNGTQNIISHVFQLNVVQPLSSTEETPMTERFTEDLLISIAIGTGIGLGVVSSMCIYHFTCGKCKRKEYERAYKRYTQKYTIY